MKARRYSSIHPDEGQYRPLRAGMAKYVFLAILLLVTSFFLQVHAGATLEGLYVGAEAPDFSLTDINGQNRAFSEIKGSKLTMVIFWSTWSRNSEKALARAKDLYSQYKDKGLAVVAINADGLQISGAEISAIKAMAGNLGIDYPILLDQGLKTFRAYGIIALPSTVVLDPDRVIRYELSGYPIAGSEEMVDFTVAQIEGKPLKPVVERKGYQPDKKALRMYNMGQNALHSKRMAATAEMWFTKAIEADPLFIQPHISLGRFYVERGNLEKAKEQYNHVLQKEPDNVVALCEMGMLLVDEDKLADGKTLMEKAIATDESYTPCFYYLGYVSGKEGNMDEALAFFDRARGINRMDMNISIYQGRTYEQAGKPEEAARAYREALSLVVARE